MADANQFSTDANLTNLYANYLCNRLLNVLWIPFLYFMEQMLSLC